MSGRVVATWAPCCNSVRPGVHEPGVMHSGACRSQHGGQLGPTFPLVVPDEYRCPDLTRTPRGPLRCTLQAGHEQDPRSLHTIDFDELPEATA